MLNISDTWEKTPNTLLFKDFDELSMDLTKIFAANLKLLLERHGLSQTAYADMIGVDRASVTNWIHAARSPHISDLPKLAAPFNISPWIMLSPNMSEAIDKVSQISTPEQSLRLLAEQFGMEVRVKKTPAKTKKPKN